MRWSMLIVAGLVAIGIAASLDALRGGSETVRQEAGGAETNAETSVTTTERTSGPAEVLSAAGVTGTLYFTLPVEEGCVLHTVALPGLEGANASLLDHCEFDVSPRGDVVSGGPCPATDIELRPVDGPPRHVRGCAPAWTPDGELTYVRDGDVLTLGGGTFVRDLARAGRHWFSSRRPVTIRALAWLTETRLAAILSGRGPYGDGDLLVFAEGRRPFFGSDVTLGAALYVDRPRQEVWIAHPGDDFSPPGITVYTRSGAFVRTAPFRANVNAFATAGERWFALGRPDNICIHERRDPPPREEFPLTCLPFDVVDLAWV